MLIDGTAARASRAAAATTCCASGSRPRPTSWRWSRPTAALSWRELEEESDAAGRRLPRARAGAGRPDRLADAEPDRPRRPLPRLLQGRPDRHPAQLPLHPPRDRPRAGGQRRQGAARPRRAGRGRGGQRARRRARAAATIAYADRGAAADRRRRVAPRASTPARRASRCRPQPQPDPADPAAIFFTSGSTGPAKGVTHTRESLRWMIASAAAAFELDADDVFLPGSSMSHIGSFLWALSTLSVGGRVVVARTTDSHELLPLLREQQPTVLAMIPAALSALIRDHDLQPHDFDSLRICRCRRRQGLDRAAARVRRRRRLPDRRGLRDDRGRPGDAQPALRGDQAGLDRAADRRLQHRPARRGRRAGRGGGGRPDLDPHPQPHGRLLGGAGGDRGGRARRSGSTPATSPAPTRTATSGSSAARSR